MGICEQCKDETAYDIPQAVCDMCTSCEAYKDTELHVCGICKVKSTEEMKFDKDVQLFLCPECVWGMIEAEKRAEAGHP